VAERQQRGGRDGQAGAGPMTMIGTASQRAIDRTWRVVAPVSRRRASSRRRRSAIMNSLLTMAIEVKPKSIATKKGPSQRALPEPDGPMIAVNDPGNSETLTPSRATTASSPRP
jgi:hypothetical protein